MHQYHDLLYLQTSTDSNSQTMIQWPDKKEFSTRTLPHVLNSILKLYLRDIKLQRETPKRLLNINKRVPLYVCDQLVLLPLKPQRATIQYYVNAINIHHIEHHGDRTKIHFVNAHTLMIDEPYTLIYRKWKESIALIHFIKLHCFI
ncbi:competence protein ComK [Staphylococcus auricularis]|uniref:competence protein ComK n=1 Tax=Staphylococcus auricularis TaxID=29379 RepID=UPI003EBD5115